MDQSFLGRGWAFPPAFDIGSGSVHMVAGKDDIDESLRILLGTRFLERVMQPNYGCGLRSLVFENINASTLTRLKDAIRRAILYCEPRIDLEGIEVDETETEKGVLRIKIDYRIRATNSRSNMVYPFYFLEGTNVSA